MFKNLIDRLAGNPYERELEQYKEAVDQVNTAEANLNLHKLPDESLGALTDLFKARIHVERQQALQNFLDTAEQETVSSVPPEAIQVALEDIPLTGEQDIPSAEKQMELRGFLHTAQEAIKTILKHLPNSERQALDESLRAAEQQALDDILPEAFAAVREASARTIGLRHYDVQIIGGIVLHQGKIAEMRTGEGKTLVATLPLYLNALTGRGAHLVTVNDYLARRDGGWMGAVYHLLGLSVGVIGKEQYSAVYDPDYVDPGGDLNDERLVHWRPTLRKECYLADITYGTSSEFGFDYLRDNTTVDPARLVQREHIYVIVDEVDSVLIDGARTPLIISGPAGQPSGFYQRFAGIIDKARLRRTTNVDELEYEEPDGDYILDDRTQSISLTDRGIEKVESQLTDIIDTASGQSMYDPQFYHLVYYLENALKAKYIFHRDKQYIVHDERIILIDQTTGRPMPSRRYSEGLHQAIEAKEGVQVRREDVTIATITVQNYFRLYKKLSGMTGTALTQAEEFDEVYSLEVVGIPTNVEFQAANGVLIAKKEKVHNVLPSIVIWETDQNTPVTAYTEADDGDKPAFFRRVDFEDQVYININAKFGAVAHEIKSLHEMGRPVLVGTGSVEASEELAALLKKMGLPHEVLNAKNHDREALIVAQAGRPGAITISTSMAGRGTDILLGGNPEGLAAKVLAEKTFSQPALHQIVAAVVDGQVDKAREEARSTPLMDDAVVDWVEAGYADLARKAEVEDILQEVVKDLHQDAAYRGAPYETLVQLVQQINLGMLDPGRLDKAREIAESVGVPLSLIPEIGQRLDEYRSLSGLMGQAGLVDALTNRLFEQHYNARAALVREVLAGHIEEAHRIIGQIPGLPASLIDRIQGIQQDCRNDRKRVWQAGGLHVIGTERHEARRIDNQLRGRAARQGDPGSSRFYLSMEDELVVRFGGERAKRMMERLNMPEDLPISASILSNAIEQWQSRFEGYYFDMRKNLVEYDEAVNIQRQTVYDERNLILTGDGADLDLLVRNFIAESLELLFERLDTGYETWAMSEIETVITDFSNLETGEVNTRGVVRRVQPLIPRLSEEELQDILAITDDQDLTDTLHELVLDGIDEGHNLQLLIGEIARIVPIWPVLPALSQDGVPGWEFYVNRVRENFDHYAENLSENRRDEARQALMDGLDQAFRSAITLLGQGASRQELQKRFFGQIGAALNEAFMTILDELEYEDLIDTLLARVDELLELIRYSKDDGGGGDVVRRAEAAVYGIGADEVVNYERALMLNVIDTEWRQYLRAIDDLRQGANLEAFGQRDPKIEFKRRAYDMFDKLREDVRSGIARGFFSELPRHRQIIERQKQQEALFDNLAQSGYRVERKVTQKGGQTKVSQTIRKDLWSNVGRNDPCPCGSGKKFKDCHYHQVRQQQQTVQQDSVVRTTAGGRKRKRRR